MLKKFLKELLRPIWYEVVGRQFEVTRNESARIQRKLSMKNDTWRIDNTLFYVPNYPLDLVQSMIVDNDKFFEQDILEELQAYIPPNAIILDIGANIGNHSLYWCKKGDAKRIYCFEPIKETFDILSRNIEINALQNIVKAVNIGLGDKRQSASIEVFMYSNIGGTSIREDANGDIKLDLLDNMCIEENKVDFMKIDVEGYEVKVLKGAEKTIEKYHPPIFIETFPKQYDIVKNMLNIWGYELVKSFDSCNYLFMRK